MKFKIKKITSSLLTTSLIFVPIVSTALIAVSCSNTTQELPPTTPPITETEAWKNVYIGNAREYTLDSSLYFGDPYVYNPFQDYGTEEMKYLTGNDDWQKIKRYIATSRPVAGEPNLTNYNLPPIGTPITFTDSIKNNVNIPNNVKRLISFFDENKWNEQFYFRSEIYSYRDFLKAVAKFPRIFAEVNLDSAFIKNNPLFQNENGSVNKEKALAYVARLELANMIAHFTQETGANVGGLSADDAVLIRPKQIPWNANYDVNYVQPTTQATYQEIISGATRINQKLANEIEIKNNPAKVIETVNNQALFYVVEDAFNPETEAAKEAYAKYDPTELVAPGFPVPLDTNKKPKVSYIGRGAKQLSWNYNYGAASRVFYGEENADILLNDPYKVEKEGYLALGTAVMFYMTPSGAKPSMHDTVTGAWQPTTTEQSTLKWKSGFGISTNIINGGIELNGKGDNNQTYQSLNRQYYFSQICDKLEISPFVNNANFFDNSGSTQINFNNDLVIANAAKIKTNYSFTWISKTPNYADHLALYDWDTGGPFKANVPGDYYRSKQAYLNSTWWEDNNLNAHFKDLYEKLYPTENADVIQNRLDGVHAQMMANDWKAGKTVSYTKVGSNYDWINK